MNVFRQVVPHAVYQGVFISCAVVLSCFIALSQGWASEKTHTNSIGMEFVLIPSGSFMMGATQESEPADGDEEPRHPVTISKAFYLGKFEVTQSQWVAVMGDNPSEFKGDNMPVDNVSWDDAQSFLQKLNQMEGTDKYRLPTEAEWEYAARAGTETTYFFGNDTADLGDYAWYDDNSDNTSHPVGQKKANPWGLFDVYGNVTEFVQDWYTPQGYPQGQATDPQGGEYGSYRVMRGGCWTYPDWYSRSSDRAASPPDLRVNHYGFRVLLEHQNTIVAKPEGSDSAIRPVARVAFFPAGEGLEECLDALGRSNISFAPRGNEALGGSLIDDAILVIPEKDYTVDVIKAELKDDGSIVPIRKIEAHIGGSGEAGRGLVFWWRMPENFPPFVVVLNSEKKNEKIWWPGESGDDGSFMFSDEFVRLENYGKTSR